MDSSKVGALIKALRLEKGYTQLELAEKLCLSDRTISKWERGLGCPDVSLLGSLAEIFGVDVKGILRGELEKSDFVNGNLKNTAYFVCEDCGNLVTATGNANVYCCGKLLRPLHAAKPDEAHELTVETIENEFYVTAKHPMDKAHYISFVVLITGNTLTLVKQYPEWDLNVSIPFRSHGKLLWYCTKHGLFYKNI